MGDTHAAVLGAIAVQDIKVHCICLGVIMLVVVRMTMAVVMAVAVIVAVVFLCPSSANLF